MITYEVRVTVDRELAERFESYMRSKHIPEILATGCFATIHFERAASGDFRTRYFAKTQEELDRYLNEHAAHFRSDFSSNFGNGASATRELWELRERWTER